MKLEGCNALITGASAGIGREFARQLGGRARSLILIARREQRLNELRGELNRQYPKLAVSFRKIDLADLTQLNELLAWLDHEGIDVDLLINNAGTGSEETILTAPDESLREGGELKDLAPTALQLLGLDKPDEMTGNSLAGPA